MASTSSSIRRRRLRTFASPDRNDGAAPPANKAGVGVPLTEQQTDNPALQKQLLDQQAKQFRRAVVVDGKDEEQELAGLLGFGSVSMMKNKLGDEYVEKSIRRLLERAEEMEREKNERNELFKNGKLYYERGACVDSIHPGTFSLPLARSRAHRPHALTRSSPSRARRAARSMFARHVQRIHAGARAGARPGGRFEPARRGDPDVAGAGVQRCGQRGQMH